MPKTLHPWIAAALAIVPAMVFTGCDGEDKCLTGIMYLVEGDTFTYLSAGRQTVGRGSSTQGPYGWRPDIEPRAKSKIDVDGYEGEASLVWNDVVVDTFGIDRTFLSSDEVAILAHEDPDGTRIEFHVYARPSCGPFPAQVSTRAQIEELER